MLTTFFLTAIVAITGNPMKGRDQQETSQKLLRERLGNKCTEFTTMTD